MNYRFSKLAIKDLNDIWLYTFQNWSKIQADRYYSLIIEEVEFIAKNPLAESQFPIYEKTIALQKLSLISFFIESQKMKM